MLAANAAAVLLAFTAETSLEEVKALQKNNEMSITVLKSNQDLITLTKQSAMAAAEDTREATITEAKAQETAGYIGIASSAGQALAMGASVYSSHSATTLDTEQTAKINTETQNLNEMKATDGPIPEGESIQGVEVSETAETPETRRTNIAAKEQELANLENERARTRQSSRGMTDTLMFLSQTLKGGCDAASNLQSGMASETAAGQKQIAASETALSSYYNSQASAMTSLWNAQNSAASNLKDAAAGILSVTQA